MYFSQRMAFALIASPSSASVMRCEMPILIDSVVKRGIGVVDTILLDGNEVRVPVVGNPITVERRYVVVVGRIRIGIGAVPELIAANEDDVVIRNAHCEVLNRSVKELIVL